MTDRKARYLWRNMMYRNEGAGLSSELIKTALERTYEEWEKRYGELPAERLRTEVDIRRVRSPNPGYCYLMAGWERDRIVRGKLYLYAPARAVSSTVELMPSKHLIGVQLPGCAP